MANLNAAARKRLASQNKQKNFAIPSKAPGPGSYPMQSRQQAANALARASGKPDYAQVKRKVCAQYPDLPACKTSNSGRSSSSGRKRKS